MPRTLLARTAALLALSFSHCALATSLFAQTPARLPHPAVPQGSRAAVFVASDDGVYQPWQGYGDTATENLPGGDYLGDYSGYGGHGTYYCDGEPWEWQLLPTGIIYHSYLASRKESRLAGLYSNDPNYGWLWDVTLGGRAGLIRFGTTDVLAPEGWQIDLEGAAMPRLDPSENMDMVSSDFRVGVPICYSQGNYETKFGYYHLSSHLGDEYLLKNPQVARINYSRDVFIWGHSYRFFRDLRIYGEVGWAFATGERTRPWELQFGVEYSTLMPTSASGSPFAAAHGHLREDQDWGGHFTFQTGWQWRGDTGHLFRAGIDYTNGSSTQWEFPDQDEQQFGLAIWYDF